VRALRQTIFVVLVVFGVGTVQTAGGAPGATRWIVFSALPNGLNPAQLFRIETTGTGLQQITHGSSSPATHPSFSPDGKRVVFARLGKGIFVSNLDGSGVRRLTSGSRDFCPVWAPAGQRIAFTRFVKNQFRLFVVTSSGRSLRRVPNAPPAGRPTWTADGKSIFVPSLGACEKLNALTGRVQKHLELSEDVTQTATVSPNSRTVAFVGPRPSIPGCGEVSCVVTALYMADLARPKVRRFLKDAGPAGWSPDSKTVAVVYRGAIALMPVVSGGTRATLTTGPNVAAADAPPAWQPR
jgi:Tol biopolymer transport system component